MTKKPIFIIVLILQLCYFRSGIAQHDLITSLMPEVWASSFSNPAWIPEKKTHIGLPSYYFNTKGTSVDVRNFVNFNGNDPSFDLAKFANGLEDSFEFESQQTFHPIFFSTKIKNVRVGLEYSLQNNSSAKLPADLFKLAAFGNAPYVDQTLNLGPEIYTVTYQKLSIPVAIEKGKWTFGLRPSILKGIFSAETIKSELQLYTNPEYYQLELSGDFLIQSSGVFQESTSNNIGARLEENILQNGLSWKGNTGFNLDLGLRYKHNEKLTLGLSIVGLGQVTWDQNVSAFFKNGTSASDGIDLGELINGKSIDVEQTVDDLIEIFKLQSRELASFKTQTEKSVYLNARYEINKLVETGGVFYASFLEGNMEPAFAVNFRVRTGDVFSVGLSYGAHYKQWNHIGLNFLVQLGPVQLFAGTNNIINIPNVLGKKSTNLRLGLSAAFNGKKKVAVE